MRKAKNRGNTGALPVVARPRIHPQRMLGEKHNVAWFRKYRTRFIFFCVHLFCFVNCSYYRLCNRQCDLSECDSHVRASGGCGMLDSDQRPRVNTVSRSRYIGYKRAVDRDPSKARVSCFGQPRFPWQAYLNINCKPAWPPCDMSDPPTTKSSQCAEGER
jgi:hypothetical protein